MPTNELHVAWAVDGLDDDMTRQPFLRFFAILLAIVAGLVLAWLHGVPQAVWRAD